MILGTIEGLLCQISQYQSRGLPFVASCWPPSFQAVRPQGSRRIRPTWRVCWSVRARVHIVDCCQSKAVAVSRISGTMDTILRSGGRCFHVLKKIKTLKRLQYLRMSPVTYSRSHQKSYQFPIWFPRTAPPNRTTNHRMWTGYKSPTRRTTVYPNRA